MSNEFTGYGGPGAFRALSADLMRFDAIRRDDDGLWLREWAVAEWCKTTVFPASIARWVADIGRHSEWRDPRCGAGFAVLRAQRDET